MENTKRDNGCANNMFASELIHPGEMIRDEIEFRGITQKALAKEIGISESILSDVLNGKRSLSVEYALLLEAALGIDADIWLRLQLEYNKQKASRNRKLSERLSNIRIAASFL